MNQPEKGKVEELYEERMLILFEDLEKGVFYQVLLNKDQYKKVSDIISNVLPSDNMRPGFELVEILTGEKEYPADIFIGCKPIKEND